MPDCFSKSEVTDFMNFMKLPDGTSVVSDDMMEYLMAYGFFTAPASTKYHGNYEGGLLNHSRMVTEYLLALTQANHLIWRKARSPFIVGMFHDLCKIDQYFDLLNEGCTPQEARSVLPNSLKTEVVMTADLREWRHFCRMRCPVAAHPDMRIVANMLLTLLKQTYPVFFEDIEV